MLFARACVPLMLSGMLPGVAPQEPLGASERPRLPPGLPSCEAVAVADLDGDRLPDLLRAGDGGLQVLVQAADTTMHPHPRRPWVALPAVRVASVAPVRIRNGPVDVLVAMVAGPPLLLRNDGSGGLAPQPSGIPDPGVAVAQLATADFDGSGLDDVLLLPASGAPRLYLANGVGGWTDGTAQWLPPNQLVQSPRAVAADIDGDLDADVLLITGRGILGWLRNSGVDLRTWLVLATGGVQAAAIGDLDGDGLPDLALGNAGPPPSVSVLLGRGGGAFQPLSLPQPFVLDAPAAAIALADVDGDGRADVAVVQADGRCRLGYGDGQRPPGLRLSRAWLPSAPQRAPAAALADIDGDGTVDIWLPDASPGVPTVGDALASVRRGELLDSEAPLIPAAAPAPAAVVAVDVDRDLAPDLLGYSVDGAGIVYRGDGSGRFAIASPGLPALGVGVADLAVGSLTAAQSREILVRLTEASGATFPPGVRVLRAGQGGAWTDLSAQLPPVAWRAIGGVAAVPAPRASAVDALALGTPAGTMHALTWTGNAFAEVPSAFQPGNLQVRVVDLLVGDIDGDGLADVVAALQGNIAAAGVRTYLQQNGTAPRFVAATAAASPVARAHGLHLGDFDGDGRVDLVGAVPNAVPPVQLLHADGSGGFVDVASRLLPAGLPGDVSDAAPVAARDGPLGVVLLRAASSPPLWLQWNGSRFLAPVALAVHGGAGGERLLVVDLDTDGDADVLFTRPGAPPGVLFGRGHGLEHRGWALAGRRATLRARGPYPGSIAALMWSPRPAALALPGYGVLRLAAPSSLLVFPFLNPLVEDLSFPLAAATPAARLYFQLAVFDPRSASVQLGNLETLVVLPR